MEKESTGRESASRVCYEAMESFARERIQSWLQGILEAEVEEFLGRGKSVRRIEGGPARAGYRNGYGKPRRVSLTAGSVEVRRPRLRNLSDRFESAVLPLFKRRTQEVGALLPRLYLHGLASGDFELALRGLLGEGAPLSASSLARLKGIWQGEHERWKGSDLSGLEVVYGWADGLYVKAGIADRKAALAFHRGGEGRGGESIIGVHGGGTREQGVVGLALT